MDWSQGQAGQCPSQTIFWIRGLFSAALYRQLDLL